MSSYSAFKSHVLLLLAGLLVAGSFPASAQLAGLTNPYSLTLLRFVAAALILLPLILLRPHRRNAVVRTLPRAAVIALFYSLFFVGFFTSLESTTALNTATLYTLAPLITALISAPFFKERIRWSQFLIYIVGALGTIWVIFEGRIEVLLEFSLNNGDLLFVAATLSMCVYTLCAKLLYRNDDTLVLVFCTLIMGALWMSLALIVTDQPLELNVIHGTAIWAMSYLVIGATIATIYIYQITTVLVGPSRVNAYIYLNPALVALLSLVIDSTTIPLAVVPGIAISALATFALQRSR